VIVRIDEQEALRRVQVEEEQRARPVVEEEYREREDEHRGVSDADERVLGPAAHVARRIREGGMANEHVPEIADREEHGEEDRLVAVAQLAQEQRVAGRDHQEADAVPRTAGPGEEPGAKEHPADRDRRRGALPRRVDVVDLDSIGDGAQCETPGRECEPERPHAARTSARIPSGVSRSFEMKPAAPLSPTRRPKSSCARLETSTTFDLPPASRSATS